eukprot:4700677-Alexandrium_andersonii.AAC.1
MAHSSLSEACTPNTLMPNTCCMSYCPAPGPRASPSAKTEGNAEGLVPWYTTARSSRWLATRPPAPKALPGNHSGPGAAFS